MVRSVPKRRPFAILCIAAAAYYYQDSRSLGARVSICEETCNRSTCDQECLINDDQLTTCGDYGVCNDGGGGDGGWGGGGDGGGGGGGNTGGGGGNPNCPSPSTTVLVNGSFDSFPPWVQVDSPERNAIRDTYCAEPQFFPWVENSLIEVLPPYAGMVEGGIELAGYLNGVSGDRNVITHSHGGNVALMATWAGAPAIKHLINLATPVNYDFGIFRFAESAVEHRCEVSSGYTDWTQFGGASPYFQIYPFVQDFYEGVRAAYLSAAAAFNGDWETAVYFGLVSAWYFNDADSFFWSTKIEVDGPTYVLMGYAHSDMHEPEVWSQIKGVCALN
jgi:hypothetical protein